ncbi:putative Zinc finger C2HC domain-containing protein [Helianthus debilis subsp. tardiflorus]
MGARVPVQQYNLRSADSYIDETSLHDLNTVDGRGGEIIEPMVDRDAVTDGSLDNEDDSGAVECMHESYQNSLPLHNVGVEGGHSSLDTSGSSRDSYNILSVNGTDISPIETARARFLDFIVDTFIGSHVVEVTDSETDMSQSVEDKTSKRKTRDIQYEGDPQFVLPLMYVANVYETLVNEVNMRLDSLDGMREKTIGVALEAAGGLYRKLAKKFPRKGACTFKRRELATSFETRSRFPELVIQEEKRVRFVVVNGLDIIEKPTITHTDDAEWFKRLTGRSDVAISPVDYKFYAPRHKYRRTGSNSVSSIPGFPTFPGADNSSQMSVAQGYQPHSQQQTPSKQHMQSLPHQGQFHMVNPNHQSMGHGQYSQHNQCGSEIGHTQGSSTMSQQMACLQPLGHLGGRLHVLPTSPAKFCDECGAPYLRETSKFCSECGVKRLGT